MIDDNTITSIKSLLQQCQFQDLCDQFFADEFHWVIKGTSMLSGTYRNKADFFETVIGRLNALLEDDWHMTVIETYVDQNKNTLIVEMKGSVKTKFDTDYNNEYCWLFKFNNEGKVKQLIAYYDSLLVDATLMLGKKCP